MEKIKVLLADDKEIFREGLARLLEEQENMEVVSQCSNGKQTIERVKETEPDMVLMDSGISDCDSVKAARHINESSPEVKVVQNGSLPSNISLLYLLREVEGHE